MRMTVDPIGPGQRQDSFSLHFRSCLRRLREERDGVSMVEFAMILPLLVMLGTYGTEVAHKAITNMQISQLALSVADNASRLGQTDNSSVTPTITESDIDSVMFGAVEQGKSVDLLANGRVILSSLEMDPVTGEQYIHWQRCRGGFGTESDYGPETPDGSADEPLSGMGKSGLITARPGSAVMFVEVKYQYQPLFDVFSSAQNEISQEAAFVVRDDRDLTPGVTGTGGESPC
jgi:Flp pilus assembly pilin Flp